VLKANGTRYGEVVSLSVDVACACISLHPPHNACSGVNGMMSQHLSSKEKLAADT
jgi:hypothetical protein